MKKRIIIFIIVLITCNAYSQTITDMVYGPLLGYTFIPKTRTFMLYTQYTSRSATSCWDIYGNEISYSSDYDGEVNPKLTWNHITLVSKYSINDKFCLSIFVPFVVNQKLEANPAPGYEYYTDLQVKRVLEMLYLELSI